MMTVGRYSLPVEMCMCVYVRISNAEIRTLLHIYLWSTAAKGVLPVSTIVKNLAGVFTRGGFNAS